MSVESENNFTIEGSTDNPLNLGGRNPRNHYTVQRPWYRNTTYGGMHEDIWKAINQQIKAFTNNLENNEIPQALDSFIVYIEEGQEYVPWGSGDTHLEHGVNDGFHGAPLISPHSYLKDVLKSILNGGN